MPTPINRLFTLPRALGLVIALGATPLFAQNAGTVSDGSPLFRGEQLLQNGSYAAAAEVLRMTDGLNRADGLVGASRALSMMGNYQEAQRILEQEIGNDDYADHPLLATQLAEVKRSIGQSAAALEILAAVMEGLAEPPLRSIVQYGSLLQFTGRKQEAYRVLETILFAVKGPIEESRGR